MDKDKAYITEISKADLREIAGAANAYAGDGIDVTRTDDGLMISIDRAQFTRWVKTIMNGGNI